MLISFNPTILFSNFTTATYILLIAIAITLKIGFIVFIINRIRRNDKRKIIALEQRLLISQMNPHFVF
ncbi:MAG: hypothetical protein CVT98_08730, partial [Bacteroidetes bacterium HGW-Bacteroidetes-15]